MQTEGYVDLLREYWSSSEDAPAGVFGNVEFLAHNNLPLFATASYTDQEWKDTVGFTVKDVTESIMAGSGPPSYYQAVRGSFTAEDIASAAKTGPLNEHMETMSYGGYEFYSWGEDYDIHLRDWRSGIRTLGRGHRLAYVDGFALWMLWTDGVREMIDSYDGKINSLADNADYRLLAGALEEMDTVTAFFSTESQALSHLEEVFQDKIEELRDKGQEQIVEEFENEPLLKPYLALAAGAGRDENGTYLVIALANSNERSARDNASLLERRIKESKMFLLTEVDRKWMDHGHVQSMEITSQGRLTVAKLYGPAYTEWDNFDITHSWGLYLPLLLHE